MSRSTSSPVHGIQVGGGLVGKDDQGMRHQGARNGDALALAAGKLEGLVPQVLLQAHRRHELHHPLVLLLLRELPVEQEGETDVLVHVQNGEEVEGLENEAERPVAVAGALPLRQRLDVITRHADLPAVGESIRPIMLSSVVLPLPEGPATQTKEPLLISRSMLFSARTTVLPRW